LPTPASPTQPHQTSRHPCFDHFPFSPENAIIPSIYLSIYQSPPLCLQHPIHHEPSAPKLKLWTFFSRFARFARLSLVVHFSPQSIVDPNRKRVSFIDEKKRALRGGISNIRANNQQLILRSNSPTSLRKLDSRRDRVPGDREQPSNSVLPKRKRVGVSYLSASERDNGRRNDKVRFPLLDLQVVGHGALDLDSRLEVVNSCLRN
jgi:hypothetical protein